MEAWAFRGWSYSYASLAVEVCGLPKTATKAKNTGYYLWDIIGIINYWDLMGYHGISYPSFIIRIPIVGWMTMPHVLSFDHGASFNFTMDDGNGSHCGV